MLELTFLGPAALLTLFFFATPKGRRLISSDEGGTVSAVVLAATAAAVLFLSLFFLSAARADAQDKVLRLVARYSAFEAVLSSPDPAVRTAVVDEIAEYEAQRQLLVHREPYWLYIPASVHKLPDATELLRRR